MVKINKTKHITRKGVVKKNPTKEIYIKVKYVNDWKEDWTGKQLKSAMVEANKVDGKLTIVDSHYGSDSKALYVYKGVTEKTLNYLDSKYGVVLFEKVWRAESLSELKRKLEKLMKKEGW